MWEKSTLAYSSPLYGRRTGQIGQIGQIKVQPILFRHIHEFFPGLSQYELVKIYGATGGVPFYLQFFDPDDTFQNNLRHHLLAKYSVLYAEGEFLLREELREPATFMNILFAISRGAARPVDIAARSFIEAKDLPLLSGHPYTPGFCKKRASCYRENHNKKDPLPSLGKFPAFLVQICAAVQHWSGNSIYYCRKNFQQGLLLLFSNMLQYPLKYYSDVPNLIGLWVGIVIECSCPIKLLIHRM